LGTFQMLNRLNDTNEVLLLGIVFLAAAALFWFFFDGLTFYVSFIPLTNEVIGIACALIGVLIILVGILGKGAKKEDK